MSLNEVATNKCFRGLKCAYTGKPVTVRVIAYGRAMPMYFSPDAYDPADPQPSGELLLQAAGTRNGIIGAKRDGGELICPYTGKNMTINQDASGFFLSGGFSPSRPEKDPERFAAVMRMRGGVLPKGVSLDPRPRVTAGSLEEKEPPQKEKGLSDEALAAVEPLAVATAGKRIMVTVPGVPGKRKKD